LLGVTGPTRRPTVQFGLDVGQVRDQQRCRARAPDHDATLVGHRSVGRIAHADHDRVTDGPSRIRRDRRSAQRVSASTSTGLALQALASHVAPRALRDGRRVFHNAGAARGLEEELHAGRVLATPARTTTQSHERRPPGSLASMGALRVIWAVLLGGRRGDCISCPPVAIVPAPAPVVLTGRHYGEPST
jgi:hypothetical protein